MNFINYATDIELFRKTILTKKLWIPHYGFALIHGRCSVNCSLQQKKIIYILCKNLISCVFPFYHSEIIVLRNKINMHFMYKFASS